MIRNSTSVIVVILLVGVTCAAASGSGAVARQSVRLEVIPVVEVDLSPLSENESSTNEDQTATGEVEFGEAPLVVSPEGYGAKITVTSEPGMSVEVSVEAHAEDGHYPKAAIRLTLTDP